MANSASLRKKNAVMRQAPAANSGEAHLNAEYTEQVKHDLEMQKYHEQNEALDPYAYTMAQSPGVQAGLALVMPEVGFAQGATQFYGGAKTGDKTQMVLGALNMFLSAKAIGSQVQYHSPLTPVEEVNVPAKTAMPANNAQPVAAQGVVSSTVEGTYVVKPTEQQAAAVNPEYTQGGGTVKFAKKVSAQKMIRHLEGTAPENKSYFSSIKDAQTVLDAYNSGNYRLISENVSKNTVTIEVQGITGRYVNTGNPDGLPDLNLPTNKFMIQSSANPKIVPVNPQK